MDSKLLADMEATLVRVRELRDEVRELPTMPGQREALQGNPAAGVLAQQQTHWRGLLRLLGPKPFADELAEEFKATGLHCKALLRLIDAEGHTVRGQRGAYAPHPATQILSAQQTHLRGVARLLKAADAQVPLDDAELAGILD